MLGLSGLMIPSVIQTTSNDTPPKISPPALKKGDTIALTAPAGAIFNQNYIDKIEIKLKNLGFKVVKGETLQAENGYLAGSDDLRANELHSFFQSKNVHAILAMRGGWGCARLFPLLDFELIKNNPKIIMGYSDLTSLLIAITNKTGLITYHGPMGYSSWKSFSSDQVLNTLVYGNQHKIMNPPDYQSELKTYVQGTAKGELVGGNLTVVCSLLGTEFEPRWQGKILFLEETKEEPYRIDRLLWQLKLAGVFQKINGLVLGAFNQCEAETPEESFTLSEVFDQHFNELDIPVYSGAAFGHIIPKIVLPIGVLTEMDANQFSLQFLESPVKR